MTATQFGSRMPTGFPHGLMFHRFHGSSSDCWQGALTPEQFEAVLLTVGIENVLSPERWIERLADGSLSENHVCVTFDDGLKAQMRYALPVLERHQIQAFWFVYTCVLDGKPVTSEIYSFVASRMGGMDILVREFLRRCPPKMRSQLESAEFVAYENRMLEVAPFYSRSDLEYRFLRNKPENRQDFEGTMSELVESLGFDVSGIAAELWLSAADLKDLVDRGHALGLHSHDHPYDLGSLPEREQRDQYVENFEHLVRATGTRPVSASHPLNSYSPTTLAILRELGITCGFRANMAAPASGRVNQSPLELAREDSSNLLAAVEHA